MTDQALSPRVIHVRCDNPGPMTLSGTNTYVVALRGADEADVAVIDPGPDLAAHPAHLDAVVQAAVRRGGSPRVAVLLTHHHADHSQGVPAVVARLEEAGLPVRVHGASARPLPTALGDLVTVASPGHTADSAAFHLVEAGGAVLFSGDTVLGGSSSFVAYPDGDLTDYLESLERLRALVRHEDAVLAPGHGIVGGSALAVIEEYLAHRQERLAQVARVLETQGDGTDVGTVVDAVYPGIDPALRPAVEAIVQAQLKHLRG